ncbi:hypothetical protein [Deinococcus aquaedulcis]|uniref:hypothetical protein n=1 Tax=Deinococcus aquaedulcis TaxID=2840455 RepID=UPI001C82A61D|nr:hypothetical protein [Deinococcus aquaedulcis]
MKPLLLAAGLLLTACARPDLPTTPTVLGVQLPAQIGATEPLPVTITVDLACGRFEGFATSRTPSQLSVQVQGTRPEGAACAAVVRPYTFTVTDSGEAPRTGPFAVLVGGRVWGAVEVR